MFKLFGIIFCAALLFAAGCATDDPGGPPPMEWLLTTNAAPVKLGKFNPPTRPVVSAPTNRPSPPRIIRREPILTWTSLERWAQENRLPAPRKVASSPLASYAVSSGRGTFTLVIGSREAIWRGMEIHLGFAPEIIDNQVFVHGLDLQKNLMPLILGAPLAFGTNRVIVLDPGHGGIAGGTISVLDKRPEKEFTLNWARRLKPLLEQKGWQVYLTRTNDVDVALSNRVSLAESHHADLFVSLHFNSAAPDKRQSGLETYCLTPVGMPSTLTRGYPDVWSQAFPNNGWDTANLQLAVRLHGAVLHASGGEDRGIRRARFMGVLHGPHCPAVLIEGGFLSNAREAEKIESGAFRQKLAEAVANALK